MKYYIATSTANKASHRAVRDGLKQLGHEITYDWTVHGSVRETSKERLQEVAQAEFEGIQQADFVLVLLPGGKGTHAELGFSIACEKQVIVHSEDPLAFELGPQVCAFYHHRDVKRLVCPMEDVAEEAHGLLDAPDEGGLPVLFPFQLPV